jgi:hypothetical protein
MRNILFCVLFSLFGCNNKYKIEKELEKCYFSSFSDNGLQAKVYMKEFESILIQYKTLKNSSDKEYYNLFTKMIMQERIFMNSNYSFSDSLGNISNDKFIKYSFDCINVLKNKSEFETSITNRIRQSLRRDEFINTDSTFISNKLKDVYPKDYFKLDLHKLKFMVLLDVYSEKKYR